MRFVAPLDKEALHSVFRKFRKIITVEDGFLKGGFGSAVIEFMCDNSYNAEVKRLGIPDYFVEHGSLDELHKECGFDQEGIEKAIREWTGLPLVTGKKSGAGSRITLSPELNSSSQDSLSNMEEKTSGSGRQSKGDKKKDYGLQLEF